jgi:hypothetical protein
LSNLNEIENKLKTNKELKEVTPPYFFNTMEWPTFNKCIPWVATPNVWDGTTYVPRNGGKVDSNSSPHNIIINIINK